MTDGSSPSDFQYLFEVVFLRGVPLRPLGRPFAPLEASRYLFGAILGHPRHHFGHLWGSLGRPGCPIGRTFRPQRVSKERKVGTVC